MKRHHVISVFCIISAGLSLYKGFHDGDIGRAIGMGIAFTIFGVIALFYGRLRTWLRPVVIMGPVVLLVLTAYRDFISGDIVNAIVAGCVLIIGLVLTLYQDKPFVKEKVRPWLRPISFIAMVCFLILALYFFFSTERKGASDAKTVGERQKSSVSEEAALNSDLQAASARSNLFRVQKLQNLVSSETFAQQLKEDPEALQSLSKFRDNLVSQGMTEYADLDFSSAAVQKHYQGLFEKYYPGKTPSDLDSEMKQQFLDVIQELGYKEGRKNFVGSQEVAIWAMARFNALQEDGESISTWMTSVYTDELGDTENTPDSDVPRAMSREADPFEETTPDLPFAEKETELVDRASTKAWGESTIPDTDNRGSTVPAVEPEKVVTEVSPELPTFTTEEGINTTLRERFSPERFERAMDTLDRYEKEEGLRRLRESDPELAKQIKNARRDDEHGHREKSGGEEAER